MWQGGLTFVGLRFEDLARGLVLELVVLAQVAAAEGALVDAAAVAPHAALALAAHGVLQRARAPVHRQALLAVANPRLAVVAHGALNGRNEMKMNDYNDSMF